MNKRTGFKRGGGGGKGVSQSAGSRSDRIWVMLCCACSYFIVKIKPRFSPKSYSFSGPSLLSLPGSEAVDKLSFFSNIEVVNSPSPPPPPPAKPRSLNPSSTPFPSPSPHLGFSAANSSARLYGCRRAPWIVTTGLARRLWAR